MKAILVIDMPESCEECCCAFYTEGMYHDYCQAVGYKTDIKGYGCEPSLFDKEYKGKRPDWCPLKPLPRKRGKITLTERTQDIDHLKWQLECNIYSEGYNKCIDEILGEEE